MNRLKFFILFLLVFYCLGPTMALPEQQTTLTPVPRKILIVYSEDNVYESSALLFATFPLNYLGYATEYKNIKEPLPTFSLKDRYAGILVWANEDTPTNKPIPAFYPWLLQQIKAGIPVVLFDYFGFPLTEPYLKPLGLNMQESSTQLTKIKITTQAPLFGFETPPLPDPVEFLSLHLAQGKTLLTIATQNGETGTMAAITPWGGYVRFPYVMRKLPNNESLWVINPFEFLKTALRLQPIPIPDTTTENGRRLMMVHVDGDAFISRAEWNPNPIAGQAMLQEIFQRYRVPTDVSVIIGEIAPFGIAPQLSALSIETARKIFALPWVEIASHTYSHPFMWQNFGAELTDSADAFNQNGKQYHLPIPNYHFNINTEITGSVDYINRYLAPKGKYCKVIHWSGDSQIPEQALALAAKSHVVNINGGNTTINFGKPSLANVAPLGIKRGPYFQLFSPNQNDNVYTNLWQGPYYGYSQVIQSFELTETPYRLKPIDIYYHFFSATKTASLLALKQVYEWALKQNVFNLYISDYFNIALDFNNLVLAREGDAWLITSSGQLRELRVPQMMGIPDLKRSENVIGYNAYHHVYYIHLGPALKTKLYFTQPLTRIVKKPQTLHEHVVALACRPEMTILETLWLHFCYSEATQTPYLQEANGRVTAFKKTAQGFDFSLSAYLPLSFTLADMQGCRLYQNQKLLLPAYRAPGQYAYTLLSKESGALSVVCR